MTKFFGKAAFAAALFGVLLGFSTPSSAVPIAPGGSFNILFDPALPDTYDHVSWQLLFSEVGPFQPGQTITVAAFDSANNFLGIEVETQPFAGAVTNISSGFDILPTTDLFGYITVTSVDASFDWIGGSATLDHREVAATPLPAALPLFASGLGAIGFMGWRRKRKATKA